MINSLRADDGYGRSLLMDVVRDDDAFDHLINKPQDLSVVNENGENVVHLIAYSSNDDDDISRRLMKLSQKTNVKSFINRKDNNGQTPLHYAAYNKHRTIETIIKLGGDVNIKDNDGETPLHLAAIYNDHRTIETIIELGGDVNLKDDDGRTPLHFAAYKNNHRTIETIIELGGDVNLKNNFNQLPDELYRCDDETKTIIRSSRKW